MTVYLNSDGYETLRERKPLIEWYAELQKSDGSQVVDRFLLTPLLTSDAGVNPMVFELPVTGQDVVDDGYESLPITIEKVVLYESEEDSTARTPAVSIDPLLLVLAADEGTITLTITLPEVS